MRAHPGRRDELARRCGNPGRGQGGRRQGPLDPPRQPGARLSGVGEGVAEVVFDEPEEGVAPGQACVLYDGDRVLGGGWIKR